MDCTYNNYYNCGTNYNYYNYYNYYNCRTYNDNYDGCSDYDDYGCSDYDDYGCANYNNDYGCANYNNYNYDYTCTNLLRCRLC